MTSPGAAPRSNATGAGLVVLAAICFATLGPLTRFADDAGVGPLGLATWRAGIGAAFVGLFISLRAFSGTRPVPFRSIPARDRRFLIGAAIANGTLNLTGFIAFTRIEIALALLVFYFYPAMVALISAAWFGERLDRLRWFALGVSCTGLVIVLAGTEGGLGRLDPIGIGLAFVGGLAQVFYVLAARHGFPNVPGPQAVAATLGGAMLFYLAIGLVTGAAGALGAPLGSMAAAWPVVVAGVIGAGIPTLAYIVGIRRLGPPRAAILSMLEPVFGVGFAALLLGEQPAQLQVIGGAFILVAAIILQRGPRAVQGDHEAIP